MMQLRINVAYVFMLQLNLIARTCRHYLLSHAYIRMYILAGIFAFVGVPARQLNDFYAKLTANLRFCICAYTFMCLVVVVVFAYLYSGFGQIDFQRHFLSHKYVRITGFTKQRLQHVQLGACKCGSFASLLSCIHTCGRVRLVMLYKCK